MRKIRFSSEHYLLAGHLFLKNKRARIGFLFLHGGGNATKERYSDLQKFLLEKEIPSLAFDFRGVGESESEFREGSLKKRLVDAISAYDELKKYVDEIVIVGASMGGHIAIQLTTIKASIALILLYPAAYAREAEEKLLNEEFTNILRQENSWLHSPVFPILEKYKGRLLIIYGEQDAVVPVGVQETYKRLIKGKGRFIILKNASHAIFSPQNGLQEQAKDRAFMYIAGFLDKVCYEK